MTRSPFMFGIYGTKVTKDMVSLFKRTGACSVLLLGRNIESPKQLRALIAELQQRLGRALLFAIDHEGGWVLRFSSGVTGFPGNGALGAAGRKDWAYGVGKHMALELKALGIGLNLAPVVDVLAKTYNPGIGMRSFGQDPKLVSTLGAAMLQGMQHHGLSACAKHFPGKGAAKQDAHVTLPTIRIAAAEFKRAHLAPFAAAVEAGVESIMTSHVYFPSIDRKRVPATFSRKIVHGLIREKLKYDGLIISDDLCMGAITQSWPLQHAAVEALQAGHDLLIIAHDRRGQQESAELLSGALGGELTQAWTAALTRIDRLIARQAVRAPEPPDRAAAAELAAKIAQAAVEVVATGKPAPPLSAPSIALLWPNFSQVQDRFTFEGGPAAPGAAAARALKRCAPKAELIECPISDPNGAREAVEKAKRHPLAVLFCFEAMRFPGQAETLKLAQARLKGRLVVCLIRNSHDRALVGRGVTVIDAHGYRDCSISAAIRSLVTSAASRGPRRAAAARG